MTTKTSSPEFDRNTEPNTTDIVRELGFKSVQAWVKDEAKRDESSGAQRTRLHRERAEQRGLKQLSVTLPVELHPMIRALAARTKGGETPAKVLAELIAAHSLLGSEVAFTDPDPAHLQLDDLPAWRHWLLRWLLPKPMRQRLLGPCHH